MLREIVRHHAFTAANQLPEVFVTLVGGCLIDTSSLAFGVGAVNEQLVTNTGRLGTGDWGDGAAGYSSTDCSYTGIIFRITPKSGMVI